MFEQGDIVEFSGEGWSDLDKQKHHRVVKIEYDFKHRFYWLWVEGDEVPWTYTPDSKYFEIKVVN